ncbi:hypothetical protein SMQC07_37500 [Serratia marcescens]|nr:hypothetical protein SMQC07_37500 [Serratia marcescens]BEN95186.1 hypothetical protein SMQC08_37990 [Serratia marcescens]BEO00473.1 hypothetical protein SMQC11_37610 [Serratia marcescens]
MNNKPSKPVVFISGPMSGIENYNRDAFNHEASQLRHIGFTVLNPAIFPDGLEHHQYLAMTLVMLEQADAIYLLDGWENSVGAKAEVIRARELNLMFLGQSWEVLWAAAAFRPALRAAMLVQERSNGGHDGKISD